MCVVSRGTPTSGLYQPKPFALNVKSVDKQGNLAHFALDAAQFITLDRTHNAEGQDTPPQPQHTTEQHQDISTAPGKRNGTGKGKGKGKEENGDAEAPGRSVSEGLQVILKPVLRKSMVKSAKLTVTHDAMGGASLPRGAAD